jgi:polyisoprenoid-binding protein YceI
MHMGKSQRRGLAVVMGLVIAIGVVGWGMVAGGPDSYAVDPAHTSATFRIQHMGISWVAGRFNDMSGKCMIDKADPTRSTFEMTIKAASIDTNNVKRDEHLRSPDFFDAKQFPEMIFKSTSVKRAAAQPAADGATAKTAQGDPTFQPADADAVYEVTGDFTMHGVTKPLTVILRGGKEAELPKGTQRVGFFSEFSLKRTDYGMDKLPGVVGNEVKIAVSLEAVKQSRPCAPRGPSCRTGESR